jgi:hypothetical protein
MLMPVYMLQRGLRRQDESLGYVVQRKDKKLCCSGNLTHRYLISNTVYSLNT